MHRNMIVCVDIDNGLDFIKAFKTNIEGPQMWRPKASPFKSCAGPQYFDIKGP